MRDLYFLQRKTYGGAPLTQSPHSGLRARVSKSDGGVPRRRGAAGVVSRVTVQRYAIIAALAVQALRYVEARARGETWSFWARVSEGSQDMSGSV